MQNEQNGTTEEQVSRVKRLMNKSTNAAKATVFYGVPAGVVGASMYLGFRTQLMQYQTAKLALEAAKTQV